jgi:hypothetical protein
MPDNVLSEGIWNRAASHWLIRDRAAPWWVIVTTAFGLTAMLANYLPIFLYVTLDAKGMLPLESAMPISYGNIDSLLNLSGDLILILLAYGAIAFLVDWYAPWQFRKNEEFMEGSIPLEAQVMPKKGDDAWL